MYIIFRRIGRIVGIKVGALRAFFGAFFAPETVKLFFDRLG
jgi:hypothetical protein